MRQKLFTISGAVLGLVSPALAQSVEVRDLDSGPIAEWVVMVIAASFVLVVTIPSFKSSKRTHQD